MLNYQTVWREEAERAQCDNPDCGAHGEHTEMFIHQLCHPKAPIEAFFHEGHLHVRCKECELPIMKIMVPYEEAQNGTTA